MVSPESEQWSGHVIEEGCYLTLSFFLHPVELRQPVAALLSHGTKLKPWPAQRLPVPGRNFVL